jgi:hypothetical protein
VFYIIRLLPLEPPFAAVAQAIVGLILLLILIDMLLGGRFIGFPRLGP